MSAQARIVDVDELRRGLLRAIMVGPVRALDLIKRTEEEFKRRGWPLDADALAGVACICGALAISAGDQVFRIPPALLVVEAWSDLAFDTGGRAVAGRIVDAMDLHELTLPR